MRSLLAVNVAAPADLVFDLVCDVARWAELLPHYVSVRPLRPPVPRPPSVPPAAVFARYIAIRPVARQLGLGVPIIWRSFSWPQADRRHLRFLHVGGLTDGMEVVWTFEPTPFGCRVSIEHSLRKRLPVVVFGRLLGDGLLPGALDRLVIRSVAGRTLTTVRALAEALARASAAAPADARAPTDPSGPADARPPADPSGPADAGAPAGETPRSATAPEA